MISSDMIESFAKTKVAMYSSLLAYSAFLVSAKIRPAKGPQLYPLVDHELAISQLIDVSSETIGCLNADRCTRANTDELP